MERVRKRSSQRKNETMWENSQMAEKKVVCRVVVHGDIKSSRAPEELTVFQGMWVCFVT